MRRSSLAARLLAATLTSLAPPVLLAQSMSVDVESGTWALTNARIETVTKGTIAKGTIVIRNGVIDAVGDNITPPPDARVMDLSGKTVYPGFIDLTSTMGLTAETPAGGRGGRGGGGLNLPPGVTPEMVAAFLSQAPTQQEGPRNVGLEPGRDVATEINPSANDVRAARDQGVTAVLVAPGRGLFRGRSALVPMRDDTASHWIVKTPVSLSVGYQGVPGQYPGTLLGVIAYQRQSLYDARRHAMVLDRYKANPRGMPREEYNPDLDALVPVVRGELPMFIAASNENEIRRALALAKEFDVKVTVVGATEGFEAIDALKSARPPVVSVDFPDPQQVTGWDYAFATRPGFAMDSAARVAAVRKDVEGNAAALNSAGIRFALASGGLAPNVFMTNVKKAIAAGLPRQTALEALTIRPAEIAGVDQQLGSIEPGKIADLVITEGDALTDGGHVRTVFVDGIDYAVVPAPPTGGRGGRAGGSSTPPNPQEKP
jgi:imidazolonepropionase-like amidohydrolase